MSKKPALSIGQTVYVERFGWLNKEPKEPLPYEVTKINTSSIYAKTKEEAKEVRFDKKTWMAKEAMSELRIWLTAEDYWHKINSIEETSELRLKLTDKLAYLTLEQLRELDQQLR